MSEAAHLMGRPVQWITRDRSSRTAETRRRKEANQKRPCDVAACHHRRDGLSTLCTGHALRLKESGDPVSRLPTRNELAIFEKAIDLYLTRVLAEGDRRDLEAELSSRSRAMSRPAAWAASPAEMHRRIPQKGRAEIVKAWIAREGGDLRDAIIRAMAVEGWAMVYFDGMERYRDRFVQTQTGLWFTRRGTPSKAMRTIKPVKDSTTVLLTPNGSKHPTIWQAGTIRHRAHISGAVRRVLGEEALSAARITFGKSFWDTPVSTQGGQDMTLLAYTKLALRAANLL